MLFRSPSGKGFTDNVSGIYTKRSDEFLRTVPDSLKPKFAELVSTARNQWVDKGAAAEIDQRNSWYRTGITERQQTLQNQVFNDPAMFDAAKEDAYRTIDSSGLSPTEKISLKKKADEMFSLTIGEREVRDAQANPNSITGAASRLGVPAVGGDAVDVVVGKIIGVESGGNANAKNPNSSATGLGQFIDSTWLGMVRKYRPDIANGKSNADIISLKTNPQLSREMTKAYTQENAQFLANQGIQQTPGNIYLAHFLGPRGAVQVLKADPSASIESIVGPSVVQANGFLRGKSASDVSVWANSKMGGKASSTEQLPADPRFASLTLSQRLSLYDNMSAAAQRGQTAINAQVAAAYESQKGSLQLGIQTGEISSDQQILTSAMKDSDKASLLSALRTRQGDQIITAQALADYQNGVLSVDPYSSDGKKRVDAIGGVINQAVAPENRQVALEGLVMQSGTVPQSTMNQLRAGAESQVPSEVEAALQSASRFSQVNPSALGRRDGGNEVQKKVDLYDALRRSGYSAAESSKRIAEQNDPVKLRERDAIIKSEPVQKVIKKVSSNDVAKVFGSGWFSSADVGGAMTDNLVRIGASIESEAQITSDYKTILEDAFGEANGNESIARDLAATRIQKIYGLSEMSVFGSKTVMRLPPEKTYEPLPDGSYGYINDQLHEALKAEGVDFDSAWLESYDATDADHQAGRPANYQIIYSKNGEIGLYNLPFYADRNAALAKYNEAQQTLATERDAANQVNRAAELNQYPDGRDGSERFSNDELYRGVAREGSPMANAIKNRTEAGREAQKIAAPVIAQDNADRAAFGALSPEEQRSKSMDDYLQGPQRTQLFKNAKDNGLLDKRGK